MLRENQFFLCQQTASLFFENNKFPAEIMFRKFIKKLLNSLEEFFQFGRMNFENDNSFQLIGRVKKATRKISILCNQYAGLALRQFYDRSVFCAGWNTNSIMTLFFYPIDDLNMHILVNECPHFRCGMRNEDIARLPIAVPPNEGRLGHVLK